MFLHKLNPLRRIQELLGELRRVREEGSQARQRIEQLEEENHRLGEEKERLEEENQRLRRELEAAPICSVFPGRAPPPPQKARTESRSGL